LTEVVFTPLSVLIVDDHEGFRSSLRLLLERSEHTCQVLEAQSAAEGLALLDTVQPDLILMDINLPGQDGLQTTQLILQQYPQMPIFIITSLEVEEYIEEAKGLGAWGILSKCDLSVQQLEDLMAYVLSQRHHG
jgi:two-component system, NarL family, nitrate/nitrite response regulator NarL